MTKTNEPKEKRTRWRIDGLDFLVWVCTAILIFVMFYPFVTIWLDSDRSFSTCNSLRECRERSGMSKELLESIDADEKLIELLSKKSKESNH